MVKSAAVARHWVEVRGLVLPAPIAGSPALELANTWAGWSVDGRPLGTADRHDYLKTYDHLVALALDRGLLGEDWDDLLRGRKGEAVLGEAGALRAASYRGLTGHADADDLTVLSDLATEARSHQRLGGGEDGVTWTLLPSAGPRAPLLAAADATVGLLTSGEADRVVACPGADCGWLFVNASGRRRWCQMAICGNRAKVRAFTQRQHGS